jgi:hypothetical protein
VQTGTPFEAHAKSMRTLSRPVPVKWQNRY